MRMPILTLTVGGVVVERIVPRGRVGGRGPGSLPSHIAQDAEDLILMQRI